ncbi:VOC family protein [Natranaerobius thermophilus]|uniref:Glyoxalase/bleomycin resistance protein/dioxygenase n=1 Tax=Natranaerobius thermophilus (strain ATCC BAA-1301 / DSM 18059 / JW/NM-WN-LF) TaxID=457570 RepID=B2A4W6_NATTJ|nr:VOC family protein [Natranaerobius thermophilus]ACB83888.1 Glyoxalase/bleomycin resistance protein/dioxygenase [Natranaerobius thermophilus JW/NM-WN-LF]
MWSGSVIFLGTNDLEKVHDFYHNVLQLPLFKDQGACRIYEIPGGGMIGFCTHMEVKSEGKAPIITLLTEEVDRAYGSLIDNGYQPFNKPKTNPDFKIYHFFSEDPNGYSLEIQKFLD